MSLKDRMWMWAHDTGIHNRGWNTPAPSRMTPVEGAYYLGLGNLIMVRYEGKPAPPFEQYVRPFRPLRQFVWSIVNAGGETSLADLQAVQRLAAGNPNMTGVMMDDFFRADSDQVGVYSPGRLAEIRRQLELEDRPPLDLWVVLYQHQLDLPVADHLRQCDIVSYWTWRAEELAQLPQAFARLEEMAPQSRKVMGCYLWDYGDKKPMPVEALAQQCEMGLQWLREGRIEGMVFLASCVCDLGLEAVEWAREWIDGVDG